MQLRVNLEIRKHMYWVNLGRDNLPAARDASEPIGYEVVPDKLQNVTGDFGFRSEPLYVSEYDGICSIERDIRDT